jgi:hypothetical protein
LIQCQVCRTRHVSNTIYCTECGAYLLDQEELETNPIELAQIEWLGKARPLPAKDLDRPKSYPMSVRLIVGEGDQLRELEVSLVKPVRLGRSDPKQSIFPEIDLIDDLAMECGVSREHAAIFGRGDDVMIEDLGSTNGTLLNGNRLDPYIPEVLNHGDQLQLGRLLIEVRLK